MRRPLIAGLLADEYLELRVATQVGMSLPFAGGNSLPPGKAALRGNHHLISAYLVVRVTRREWVESQAAAV
jgi:hypothetical protein